MSGDTLSNFAVPRQSTTEGFFGKIHNWELLGMYQESNPLKISITQIHKLIYILSLFENFNR